MLVYKSSSISILFAESVISQTVQQFIKQSSWTLCKTSVKIVSRQSPKQFPDRHFNRSIAIFIRPLFSFGLFTQMHLLINLNCYFNRCRPNMSKSKLQDQITGWCSTNESLSGHFFCFPLLEGHNKSTELPCNTGKCKHTLSIRICFILFLFVAPNVPTRLNKLLSSQHYWNSFLVRESLGS